MHDPLARPKIYHITHADNLRGIIAENRLVSDAAMISRGGPVTAIGMSSIKQRRLTLPVHCHQGDCVGDYVPFYFCPRSVMLFLIHKGNHQELTYKGGQGPIVHLEADLAEVVEWADANGRRWAFSLSNAGAYYTEFRNDLGELSQIDWNAIAAMDFRAPDIQHSKQAEFLLHGSFPWTLVERIGVQSRITAQKAHAALGDCKHRPPVEIMTDWYF
jgi:hypothetical protein